MVDGNYYIMGSLWMETPGLLLRPDPEVSPEAA